MLKVCLKFASDFFKVCFERLLNPWASAFGCCFRFGLWRVTQSMQWQGRSRQVNSRQDGRRIKKTHGKHGSHGVPGMDQEDEEGQVAFFAAEPKTTGTTRTLISCLFWYLFSGSWLYTLKNDIGCLLFYRYAEAQQFQQFQQLQQLRGYCPRRALPCHFWPHVQ